MTRKLATIQRIKSLLPIDGADKIELAIINGWQVVTQKGQHTEGDLIVFYEIDSFLPASDERYASFSDRFVKWGEKEGMRLKTIKLRKQLSQGLIMPIKNFAELYNVDVYEGADVTEVLGIEKWEPIENENTSTQANPGRAFPAFLRKTDQERIQNYGKLVELALDEEFEVTMKKDGSSGTVFRVDPASPHYALAVQLTAKPVPQAPEPTFWQKLKNFFVKPTPVTVVEEVAKEPVYGLCSRNQMLPLEGDSNFHKAMANSLAVLKALPAGVSLAIQGEVVAPSIQGNYENVTEVEFHIFDMFDIDKQSYLLPSERHAFVASRHTVLRHATILRVAKLRNIIFGTKADGDVVQACLTYASGDGDNKGVKREGVVFKAFTRDFSFKAVSNEYLLKSGK